MRLLGSGFRLEFKDVVLRKRDHRSYLTPSPDRSISPMRLTNTFHNAPLQTGPPVPFSASNLVNQTLKGERWNDHQPLRLHCVKPIAENSNNPTEVHRNLLESLSSSSEDNTMSERRETQDDEGISTETNRKNMSSFSSMTTSNQIVLFLMIIEAF